MGNSLCKDPVDTRPVRNGMTIWGDYVNSDTRTILAVMDMCSEKYVFKQLDTLSNKHLEDKDFLLVNPTMDVPVITESHYSIISGTV